jgi:hypothetical protein
MSAGRIFAGFLGVAGLAAAGAPPEMKFRGRRRSNVRGSGPL